MLTPEKITRRLNEKRTSPEKEAVVSKKLAELSKTTDKPMHEILQEFLLFIFQEYKNPNYLPSFTSDGALIFESQKSSHSFKEPTTMHSKASV